MPIYSQHPPSLRRASETAHGARSRETDKGELQAATEGRVLPPDTDPVPAGEQQQHAAFALTLLMDAVGSESARVQSGLFGHLGVCRGGEERKDYVILIQSGRAGPQDSGCLLRGQATHSER
ncbi:hypothetical protein EYF80_009357 [Liparis tanakae]|uniref:Uncharacterized protein n=1 Tax=Liparis tanakae TaxID=230148 RepID=A0A4Z2IT34_9TELE|nr:hypothetical protein EYF80_009357 [Liparis tanakae]